MLRRRFDGIKYALAKVEDVVYDVQIRGLAGGQTGTGTAGAAGKLGGEDAAEGEGVSRAAAGAFGTGTRGASDSMPGAKRPRPAAGGSAE